MYDHALSIRPNDANIYIKKGFIIFLLLKGDALSEMQKYDDA